MGWPSWPGRRDDSKAAEAAAAEAASSVSSRASSSSSSSSASAFTDFPPVKKIISWTDSIKKNDWTHYQDPQTWVPPALAVGAALGFSAFYRSYLRRIPSTNHIQPRFFRRRSLLGKVTSVGDGDNFHLFHTPGGRLAGWGWLRKVPSYRKELKGQTIPVRIAGVDAPEGAHFGRPAQPYSGEALDFLTQYLLGRRVRAYLFRRDQYDRVVARVVVRRFIFFKRDVGIEMLKRGLATCYEAKTGAEFGGREAQYRVAEAKAKARKRGLWSGNMGKSTSNGTPVGTGSAAPGEVETPREYKTRMAALDAETAAAGSAAATTAATTAAKPAAVGTTTAAPAAVAAGNVAARPGGPSTTTPLPGKPSQPAAPASSSSQGANKTAAGWGKGPLPGRR